MSDSLNRGLKIRRNVLIAGIALLIGGGIGFAIGHITRVVTTSVYSVRDTSEHYKFIKPLLAVNNVSNEPSDGYQKLYDDVTAFISENTRSGEHASVFFIDYGQNGGRFTINPDTGYAPASLLKVVIMISYLKKAESVPGLLNQSIVYEQSVQSALESIPFESPTQLRIGQSYTVQYLIDKMIADSDNGAMNLLANTIGDTYLSTVYKALSLPEPDQSSNYTISAKSYSLFFRILYNATYLNNDMSEKAISILTKAKFADGLTAPLPIGTVVAHKFGEHIDGSGAQVTAVELHDCGLVYLPNNPYFLCVMTHGKTLEGDEHIIQGVSDLIYKQVSQKPSVKK